MQAWTAMAILASLVVVVHGKITAEQFTFFPSGLMQDTMD